MAKLNGKFFLVALILAAVLLLIPAVSLAQDSDGEDDGALTGCNPVALRLAEEMQVDCAVLLGLQNQGVGLGQMMKAWHLSQGLDTDWLTLLNRKQEEGIGWGQFKMAYRLAGEDGDPEALLALKQDGLGWGQIKQARAIDEAGLMSFDEAVAMMQDGLGWGEIRAQLELEPGPPPWAGGGKDKSDQGPPAWSNAGGKNNEEGGNTQGPPPWANNDKDKNNGNGN